MRLKLNQLSAALKKQLAPVYFISGDEPLQVGEAADTVRKEARSQGYDNREVFTVDSGFNWHEILQSADSYSIFSDRKIIEIRLPSGTPGVEGAKILTSYCQRLPEDSLLLVMAGKLPGASKKARWVQELDQVGVIIQVWPLTGNDLTSWLKQRMLHRGLQADQEIIQLLANRLEGNLLAAAQEIEKLYMLFGSGKLSKQAVVDTVSDSSRYDVFNLVESALAGQIGRSLKILQGLKAEGIAPPVVLWSLTRESRILLNIIHQLHQGQGIQGLFKKHQIWGNRQPLVHSAIKQLNIAKLNAILLLAARADRQIKGHQTGDVWETLLTICELLSGTNCTRI